MGNVFSNMEQETLRRMGNMGVRPGSPTRALGIEAEDDDDDIEVDTPAPRFPGFASIWDIM